MRGLARKIAGNSMADGGEGGQNLDDRFKESAAIF